MAEEKPSVEDQIKQLLAAVSGLTTAVEQISCRVKRRSCAECVNFEPTTEVREKTEPLRRK